MTKNRLIALLVIVGSIASGGASVAAQKRADENGTWSLEVAVIATDTNSPAATFWIGLRNKSMGARFVCVKSRSMAVVEGKELSF